MGNPVRFLIFVGVAGALSFLLHRYLWVRLVRDALLPEPWHRAGTVALVALGLLMPLAMPLGRLLPRSFVRPIAVVAYGWMGLMFILVTLLAAGDVVRLLGFGSRWLASIARPGTDSMPIDPARRAAFGRGIAAIAAVGGVIGSAWGVKEVLSPVRIRPLRVALERLPPGMNGLTVAQISDVHIGPTIGRAFVEQVVRRTNELAPDVVVITGDLVDGSVARLADQVAPLADLKAPLGVFFVTGNHEYYSGVDEWLAHLPRLGIRVLRNERVEIRRGDDVIDLAGIDDFSATQFGRGHGPDLPRALRGRDPERELLLLAHQPRAIVEAATLGVGLQLSGHTHGGQIFPWNFMVRLQQPYVSGLHRHEGAQIYVSRGTGYWGPPMRVGAPAEITQITLVCA